MENKRLNPKFYRRTNVLQIAQELLGKILITEFEGRRTAGRISELEAYRAPDDRACHAYGNRRTARTEVMFHSGGRAYVYLCYGIHHLFNVVTGPEDMAHAVLIRAVEPLEGVELMFERRRLSPDKLDKIPARLTTGPGSMAQALGLHTGLSGQPLTDPDSPVWIEHRNAVVPETAIAAGPRIGVAYAGACAAWPWRYWLKESRFVSRAPKKLN